MTMLFSLSAIPRDRLSLTLGITLIRGNLSLIKAQLTIIRDDMVQLYQWQSSVSSGMIELATSSGRSDEEEPTQRPRVRPRRRPVHIVTPVSLTPEASDQPPDEQQIVVQVTIHTPPPLVTESGTVLELPLAADEASAVAVVDSVPPQTPRKRILSSGVGDEIVQVTKSPRRLSPPQIVVADIGDLDEGAAAAAPVPAAEASTAEAVSKGVKMQLIDMKWPERRAPLPLFSWHAVFDLDEYEEEMELQSMLPGDYEISDNELATRLTELYGALQVRDQTEMIQHIANLDRIDSRVPRTKRTQPQQVEGGPAAPVVAPPASSPRAALPQAEARAVQLQLPIPVQTDLPKPPSPLAGSEQQVAPRETEHSPPLPTVATAETAPAKPALPFKTRCKNILGIVRKWDETVQGELTIDDVAEKPLNRLNVATCFGDLLELAKKRYVLLYQKPGSTELGKIQRGPQLG